MRRTFNQLRVFLESNPYTAARDPAPVAPGAGGDLRLPAVAAHPGAVGARQVPAAGGGAGVPDGAVAGAGHGDRVLDPARGRLARRRVAAACSSSPSTSSRSMSDVTERIQSSSPARSASARSAAAASSSRSSPATRSTLRRADLQRHLARRAAAHDHRQVPHLLRDGHAAADAGGVLALLVGAAHRVGRA